jgi:hypothetical protein
LSFPRKRESSAVYVIAREARDTMQILDARLCGHDGIFYALSAEAYAKYPPLMPL